MIKIIIINSVFQRISSSFPYNWEKVISVINNIDYIIIYEDPSCYINTMDDISTSLFHFKKAFSNVLKDAPTLIKKALDIC